MSIAPLATLILIADTNNNGNASDIWARMQLASDHTNISYYKFLVVPASESGTFTVDSATAVVDTLRFRNIPTYYGVNALLSFNLAATQLDVNGAAIVEGVPYVIFIQTVGLNGYENSLTEPSEEITLAFNAPAVNPTYIYLYDVANNRNASDLQVQFTEPSVVTNISGYRVYVVPTSDVAIINLTFLAGLASNQYGTVTTVGASNGRTITLSSSLLDVNGNAVVPGILYSAVVQSMAISGVSSYAIKGSILLGIKTPKATSTSLALVPAVNPNDPNTSVTTSTATASSIAISPALETIRNVDITSVVVYSNVLAIPPIVSNGVLHVIVSTPSMTATFQGVNPTVVIVPMLDVEINVPTSASNSGTINPTVVAIIDIALDFLAGSYDLISPNYSANLYVIASDSSGIAERRWAFGTQTIEYMRVNGTLTGGSLPVVWANGAYTVYAKDNAGNDGIATTTISGIIFPIDFDAGFIVGMNLGKGDDGKIGDYGIGDTITSTNLQVIPNSGGELICQKACPHFTTGIDLATDGGLLVQYGMELDNVTETTLQKLTKDGVVIWSDNGHAMINDVAQDGAGNIYAIYDTLALSQYYGYDQAYNTKWLRKLNSSGEEMWNLQGNAASFSRIVVDSFGAIYVSSRPIASDAPNLIKYDTNGNLLWSLTPLEEIYDIAIDSNDCIIVVGRSTYSWTTPRAMCKLSSSGVILWSVNKEYDELPRGYSAVAVDLRDNSVYAVARHSLTVQDYRLHKFGDEGYELWHKPTTYDVTAHNVAVDVFSYVYVRSMIYTYNSETHVNTATLTLAKFDSVGNLLWTKSNVIPTVTYPPGTVGRWKGICVDDNRRFIYIAHDRHVTDVFSQDILLMQITKLTCEDYKIIS